jgi:hypothetical protein
VAALAQEQIADEPSAQAAVGHVLCLVRWFEHEGKGEGRRVGFSEIAGNAP